MHKEMIEQEVCEKKMMYFHGLNDYHAMHKNCVGFRH